MKKKTIDIIVSIMGILFGIYICLGTKEVKGVESIFPYLIGAGVILTSIILLLVTFKQDNTQREEKKNLKLVGIMIICLIIYAFVIEYLGYLITTFMLCVSILLLLSEKRNIKRTIAVSLSISILVYALFSFVLKVPLPNII